MKKLFSLLLSLSLLCAGVAVAENVIDVENPSQSTTVTFEVPEPETSYTVTIPASVSFIEDATTTSMSVTIGGDSTLAIGATLKVILENSSNSFQLKQGDNAIAYAIKKMCIRDRAWAAARRDWSAPPPHSRTQPGAPLQYSGCP